MIEESDMQHLRVMETRPCLAANGSFSPLLAPDLPFSFRPDCPSDERPHPKGAAPKPTVCSPPGPDVG